MSEPDLVNAHEPTEACAAVHCWWHNADEPSEGAYRVCFECRHTYPTAEALRQAWTEEVGPAYAPGPAPAPPPADEILACPLCSHDW